jgi:hypothetical protein
MLQYILLLTIICFSALFANYFTEHFQINDFYSKYLNDISVPVSFYSQGKVAQNFKLIEFNDQFFKDVLEKNKNPSVLEGKVETKIKVNNDQLLQRTDTYISNLFNDALAKKENTLFAVAYSELLSIKSYTNNKFLIESRHIIHRDKKIYGTSLEIKTFHEIGKTTLVDYTILGFIFEDRIDANQPSNLDENEFQPFMKDAIFIKDKKYEKQYLCKYYADLKKFRGIDVPNTLECDQ